MRIESPGFFDLQVNGFAGVDFNDPSLTGDDLDRAIAALRATGVTSFLPTLITAPLDAFSRCARTLAARPDPAVGGIHLEGPYLAPQARGAHPEAHLGPASREDFARRQDAAQGRIVLVTLAPEIPGALPLIEHLVAAGIRVALGHTVAPPSIIRDAIRAGATLSTHLGNGCPLTLPRHPNLIWEQLAADELAAGLIVDGFHLDPAVVKVMVRAKTAARAFLVTDATAAAGAAPGPYHLGAVPVELSAHGRVTVAGTSTLAGSALTLDTAVGNTVRFTGLPLAEVLAMASTVPAGAVGLAPRGRVVADWQPESCRLLIEEVRTP